MTLKPCPFCGSEGDYIDSWSYNDRTGEPVYWYVRCENCEAEGPASFTKEKSEKKWNTRGEKEWKKDIDKETTSKNSEVTQKG